MQNPIIDKHGNKEWYQDGKLHREDGHAREYADGTKQWFLNDKCHRDDGPAIEYANGYNEWWLHGKEYTEDLYRLTQFNNKCKIQS
jgi:hypothetical protein